MHLKDIKPYGVFQDAKKIQPLLCKDIIYCKQGQYFKFSYDSRQTKNYFNLIWTAETKATPSI